MSKQDEHEDTTPLRSTVSYMPAGTDRRPYVTNIDPDQQPATGNPLEQLAILKKQIQDKRNVEEFQRSLGHTTVPAIIVDPAEIAKVPAPPLDEIAPRIVADQPESTAASAMPSLEVKEFSDPLFGVLPWQKKAAAGQPVQTEPVAQPIRELAPRPERFAARDEKDRAKFERVRAQSLKKEPPHAHNAPREPSKPKHLIPRPDRMQAKAHTVLHTATGISWHVDPDDTAMAMAIPGEHEIAGLVKTLDTLRAQITIPKPTKGQEPMPILGEVAVSGDGAIRIPYKGVESLRTIPNLHNAAFMARQSATQPVRSMIKSWLGIEGTGRIPRSNDNFR